ncbi:hypothetical protein BH11BAC2_BH11BAC2_14500 [soil metagenome]
MLDKSEPILYWILLLVHLIPIFLYIPFPTLDGPAHLYNANLINWMLHEKGTNATAFFHFNSFPEPNWSGHLLMMFFLQFFSPEITSVLVLLLIILISAIGYRKLIQFLDPQTLWMSWLFFPFIYNFTFCLGFFNFSIAVALIPWILLWWIKNRNELTAQFVARKWSELIFPHYLKRKGGIFTLLIFMMALYFSHLVIFLITGLFLGLITLNDRRINTWKEVLPQLLILAITALPGLVMSAMFVLMNSSTAFHGQEISYLPMKELMDYLLKARMLVVYTYETESSVSQIFLWMLIPLTVVGVKKRIAHQYQRPFLLAMIIALLMVFIIPDSLSSGGILSVRIVQLFFMMWCIWLATLKLPLWTRPLAAFIAVSISCWFIIHHSATRKSLADEGKLYLETGRKMKTGSVILPLNYSTNWLSSNQPAFMGSSNRLVILDNYEASQTHFPLMWNANRNPELHLGNFAANKQPYINILNSEKTTGIRIDYIVTRFLPDHPEDSNTVNVIHQLKELYSPVFFNNQSDLVIYQRKN